MSAPPAVQAPPEPLRIVLFGLPRAGKTALLAAPGQVAQEQPPLLRGAMEAVPGGLPRQRHIFYDDATRPAEDGETVRYPLRLKTKDGSVDIELVDCDGRAVLEL